MRYPFSDIYGERTRPRLGGIAFTDPSQMARDWMAQAAGTYGRMQAGQKTKIKRPGPSAGGAIMSGLGGATAMGALGATEAGGAALGALGLGGPVGIGAGTLLGLASYLFS